MISPETLILAAIRQGINLSILAEKMPPGRARPTRDPVVKRRQLRLVGADPTLSRKRRTALERAAVTTARGKQTRTHKAAWSFEDLVLACRNMPRPSWSLLCFTVFPDSEPDRITVKSSLMVLAADLATREKWPDKIRRADCAVCHRACNSRYLEDLCTLALHEWSNPEAFRRQDDLAKWFGVHQSTWSRVVAQRFQPLREQLAIWYGDALRHIWRSLYDPEYSPGDGLAQNQAVR